MNGSYLHCSWKINKIMIDHFCVASIFLTFFSNFEIYSPAHKKEWIDWRFYFSFAFFFIWIEVHVMEESPYINCIARIKSKVTILFSSIQIQMSMLSISVQHEEMQLTVDSLRTAPYISTNFRFCFQPTLFFCHKIVCDCLCGSLWLHSRSHLSTFNPIDGRSLFHK